jgi:hypothetical protein
MADTAFEFTASPVPVSQAPSLVQRSCDETYVSTNDFVHRASRRFALTFAAEDGDQPMRPAKPPYL